MKKSTILLITALATAAFFAHSPEAERLVKNAWVSVIGHHTSGSQKSEIDAADMRATGPKDSEFLSQPGDNEDLELHTSSLASEETDAGDTDAEIENDKLARAAAEVPDNDLRRNLDSALQDHGDFALQLRELLIRRWAEIDPAAAASWAGGLRDPSIAASVAREVAIVWVNKDLAAAVEWVAALPEGETRQAAVLSLGYDAARSNSFEAFDLVAALPPSSERDDLLVHIIRQGAAADLSEAAIWADRVPDTALRERLVSAAAIASATKDPSSAASLIASNLTPGQVQDQAAVAIVQRWAQTDPQATDAWISIFPDPAVKMAASLAFASVQSKSEN